ncbi:MAG: hypothetical protein ACFFCI_06495 [Promethearchaeota archaeon]
MLNNNEECNWSDFLEAPLTFSLATLSKYMNLLLGNGYVKKIKKGLYQITLEGRKKYFDLRFKNSFDRKLRYPPEIILNKRNYDHIILWMLFNNEYCKWRDFLEKPLSINNNSLSKNLRLLLTKGFVKVENLEYRITKSGESQFSKILKKYELDYQSILMEEIKRIEDIKEKANEFLGKHQIKDEKAMIVFLDLVNHLDYAKSENLLSSKDKYYKLLLFLSMNHPTMYPEFILPNEFSLKFGINLTSLNFFLQNIAEENLFDIKFFTLRVGKDGNYFFRVNDKFEKMLNLIVDENITKYSFLHKLQPSIPNEEKDLQIISLIENIADDICNKLFDENLKRNIIKFLPEYVKYLHSKFKRNSFAEDVIESYKGMAYQNMIYLDLIDIHKYSMMRKLFSFIRKDFPKYTILEEIKRIWKQR